jgi:cytoskeletal protein CcmA (bactofilin family)
MCRSAGAVGLRTVRETDDNAKRIRKESEVAMFNKGAPGQPAQDETVSHHITSSPPPVSQPSAADSSVSTIAGDMKITGDVSASGVIRIEGQVEGSVKGARQVLIGRQGMVKGDVSAREAIVGGRIEGSVTASERVEVQGTALINGDLYAKSMLVQEGGRINGAIRMEEPSSSSSSSSSTRQREPHAVVQTGPVAVVR